MNTAQRCRLGRLGANKIEGINDKTRTSPFQEASILRHYSFAPLANISQTSPFRKEEKNAAKERDEVRSVFRRQKTAQTIFRDGRD